MTAFFQNLWHVLVTTAPWWGLTLVSFALGYFLTPMCREMARRMGMVDKPSARRINKTPIPRAGGLALYLASDASNNVVGQVIAIDGGWTLN